VAFHIWTASFRTATRRQDSERDGTGLLQIDQAVLTTLSDERFSPVREQARSTRLAGSNVHLHLTASFSFTIRHLCCVLHGLSPEQKPKRVNVARELLILVEHEEVRSRENAITLDESWFYASAYHELI
jgi:hypothetical protein